MNVIQSTPQMISKEVPGSYLRLDAQLKLIKTSTITWEKFKELAISNGITPEEVEPVSEFLHLSGALLHFNDPHGGL